MLKDRPLHTLADQIAARVEDPLDARETGQLAEALRVLADRYEPAAIVLPFRPRGPGDAA